MDSDVGDNMMMVITWSYGGWADAEVWLVSAELSSLVQTKEDWIHVIALILGTLMSLENE